MDIYAALEERIEKLIAAHKELQARVADLEDENAKLKEGGSESAGLAGRVQELETERAEVRARLEKLLKTVTDLEL
ncbi:MAG TPA: cell division protein ZapB [Thermoanaerobaculaceae bacterium]|nr:cell division protein ZapB [Thermoanaerobaculaceae bacterium]